MSLSKEDFLAFMSELKKEQGEEIEKIYRLFKEGVREEVQQAVTPVVQQQKLLEERQNSLETEHNVFKARVSVIETARDEQNEDIRSTKNKMSEMEKDNENTKSQVSELQMQMLSIQKTISTSQKLNPIPTFAPHPPSTTRNLLHATHAQTGEAAEALRVLRHSKKILGFSPITQDDIAYLKTQHSVDDDKQAMILSIVEFLNCEMKIPRTTTDQIVIMKVSPPERQPIGWTTLYAEFQDSSITDLINQYVRNLQPGKNLSIYVPDSLIPRYHAVRDIAHGYRNGSVKHKTKIKYGASDFVLLVRPKDQNVPWSYPSLDCLSPLKLSPYAGTPSFSPPPGRTRLPSKRARSPSPESGSFRQNKTRFDKPVTSDENPEAEQVPKDPHNAAPVDKDITANTASSQSSLANTSTSLN